MKGAGAGAGASRSAVSIQKHGADDIQDDRQPLQGAHTHIYVRHRPEACVTRRRRRHARPGAGSGQLRMHMNRYPEALAAGELIICVSADGRMHAGACVLAHTFSRTSQEGASGGAPAATTRIYAQHGGSAATRALAAPNHHAAEDVYSSSSRPEMTTAAAIGVQLESNTAGRKAAMEDVQERTSPEATSSYKVKAEQHADSSRGRGYGPS